MKLDLYILIVTIVTLVVGLLLGLLRGSRRSVLRLLLVLLCVVGAYFLKDVVTNALLNADFNGKNIQQIIIDQLPQEVQNMGDVIMPVILVLISTVSFLLCFGLLQFVSWAIVFPLLKLIVKKGKKKHALVGGVVGLVQGAAVAFVLCVVLNGLFVNIGNVMTAMEQEQQQPDTNASVLFVAAETTEGGDGGTGGGGSGSPTGDQMKDLAVLFKDYQGSSISKMYSKIGDKAFDLVASVNVVDEEGNQEKVTLKGQFDALASLLKIAQNVEKFENIQFGTDGIVGCADSIKEVFDVLDGINRDLSEESQKTLNKVVQNVAESFLPSDLPINVSAIDFTNVNFSQEGEIITGLANYAQKDTITEADAEDIVKKVIESDLIIPLLTSGTNENIELGLNDTQKSEALNILNKYEAENSYAADKIEKVKNFFGLNETGSEQ